MDDFHLNEDYSNKYENTRECIGIGNFTKVYKGINKDTKEPVAIKIIRLDEIRLTGQHSPEEIDNYISDLKNEINNMKICGENNINSVKYYESFQTQNEFVIVLELCDENLAKYISQRNMNSEEIYEILYQLDNTFKIMRKNEMVHRDLKPANILIKKENNKNIIKLCDYGTSKKGKYTKLISHKGTNEYMAPEIMKGEEYNYKCDLWSLGVIIYELFFKERPYTGETEYAILSQINTFGQQKLKKTGDDLLDDLISKLLEKDR